MWGQPQRRLCPQVCPGHGHIKQQLALGTKCPSRVVMHQHVLDVKVLRYELPCVSV